jgi:hypothetical protein
MILVLGTDDALLEGLAQTLAASGQQVTVARTLDDAEELAKKHPPLLLVADRGRLTVSDGPRLARVAFAVGGAVIAYRSHSDSASSLALPSEIARITLADLELPLERNRLVALALYVTARAREAGRFRHGTPPESAAL